MTPIGGKPTRRLPIMEKPDRPPIMENDVFMQQRADIQVLRGVAVSLVFLFHLNIPLFQSGFIGVDVFFVISGFLMALTLRDTRFHSILTFYRRRAKRILPAYVVVLAALVLIAPFIFLPHEVNLFLADTPYYLIGFPNVRTWLQTDYWRASYFSPALHFWSLGVELQFYVLVPLIVFIHMKSTRYSFLILGLSLIGCAIMQSLSPKTAFFMVPFRLWEFMAGFCLAKLGTDNPVARSPVGAAALFYLGLGAILALSTVPVAPSRFPWPWAVPAVLATVLVLAGAYRPRTALERPIFAVLEYLGALSYSIYLIHFPVIFIILYRPFGEHAGLTPDLATIATAAAVTLILSILSYHGVEEPLRRARYSRPWLARSVLGLAVAAPLIGPLWVDVSAAFRPQPSPELANVFEGMADRSKSFRCSLGSLLSEPFSPVCTLSGSADDRRHPTVLVVGDSHANAIKEALSAAARRADVNLLLMRKNLPVGFGDARAESLARLARAHHVDYLLLHTRSEPDRVAREIDGLRDVVALSETKRLKILFVEPVPTWQMNIPKAIYENLVSGGMTLLPRQDADDYRRNNRDLLAYSRSVESAYFLDFPVVDRLCGPTCALLDEDGNLLYHDEHHLTLTGARRLDGLFEQIFRFVASDFASRAHEAVVEKE